MSVLPPERDSGMLLLILTQIPGLGPARIRAVIDRYGADHSLLDAGPETFMAVPGMGGKLASTTASKLASPAWRRAAAKAAEGQIRQAEQLGATLVTILDKAYPPLLKEIFDPPSILFIRGNPEELSRPAVAVVGTRRPTTYGKQAAESFCRELVLNGYTITSGLAYGIDMTAHKAAVDAGGRTVAVLGCGVDTIYTDPAGRLWPKIVESGAIISEEWLGKQPAAGNFPRRNRLISGLCGGTLVVESDVKGGSMITASCALEQNREVFAVPGSIFSKASRGTNRLIQQCQAKPVLSGSDIVSELPLRPSPTGNPTPPEPPLPLFEEPDREDRLILGTLGEATLHIDVIAEKTGLSVDTLMVRLFELEIRQAVIQEPGLLFRNAIAARR